MSRYDEFFVFKKKPFVAFANPFSSLGCENLKKQKHYLCMGAIHSEKIYAYLEGSFRIFDFLSFGKYAFILKILCLSQHFRS